MPNGRGLPIYAWKINNDTQTAEDEMLIRVVKIHLEGGSFNQIYSEVSGNEEKMKETVMEIVKQRGKMHNPYTGTGGLFGGIVEKIGKKFDNVSGIQVGDEVIIPVSIAMLPLELKKVTHVNYVYNHIDVDGYTVIYNGCPVVKKTPEISWDLLLSAFEESASIKKASGFAEGKETLLVIGSNPIVTMLYGLAFKKVMQPTGVLTCVHYGDSMFPTYGDDEQTRNKLLYMVFDEVYFMSAKDPMECIDEVTEGGERLYDVIVNCADQMGAEAISVVAAKEKGNVLFSNLTNNYTTALLVQEAINRDINLHCAVGYVEGYYDFMMEFIRSIETELGEVGRTLIKISDATKLERPKIQGDNGETYRVEEILKCKSSAMSKVAREIEKASKYDCSVILNGESGTGKEVAANLIYKMSNRKTEPFVKVNCAAIPKELMESEFFGYERGAFTGASERGKDGYFKLADGGILLLDEVAEMPLELQAKLLRVLQEGEFYPVGGRKPIRVDVRVLASTNKNLIQMIQESQFREDLYYRLAVLTIKIPPLRKRRRDIIPLAEAFLEKYNEKYGTKKTFTDEAKLCLLEHEWPGNIRELDNTVHRLIIYSDDNQIASGDVLREYNNIAKEYGKSSEREKGFNETVNNFERNLIAAALERYGSTYKAAEALKMSQSQLMRKKKKYNL